MDHTVTSCRGYPKKVSETAKQIDLPSNWWCCLAALSINAPFHAKVANLLIAARHMSNTKQYIRAVGRAPDYVNPKTYSEKIQCRKLFDRNPLFPVFCDKLAAQAHAREADCGLKFAQVYWQGDDPDQIPFDRLPTPYIIKPNQGSGARLVVHEGDVVNQPEIRDLCRGWLRQPHGQDICEWGYKDVQPRLLVEELLLDDRGIAIPDGYKFFVFSGRVAYIKHFHRITPRNYYETYYAPPWQPLDAHLWLGYEADSHRITPYLNNTSPPNTLERMVAMAEHLAGDIDHLRVDFYEVDDAVYFGELTAYSDSGFSYLFPAGTDFDVYPPRTLDYTQGAKWHQPQVTLAAKVRHALSG